MLHWLVSFWLELMGMWRFVGKSMEDKDLVCFGELEYAGKISGRVLLREWNN